MLRFVIFKFVFHLMVYLETSNVCARKYQPQILSSFKEETKWEGKIVGGKPISLETVPYTVQIFNMGAMCAGTILNSWAVVTAAHCFDMNKNIEDVLIQIGSRFIYDFNGDQYNVAKIVIHNKYNQSGIFAYDIAMVFVDSSIEFSAKTQKTVLVNTDRWMSPKEKNFTVTGWGLTQYDGEVSKEGLMMSNLRYVDRDACSNLHQMTISYEMFCLYGDGLRDTCKGDSGGGVFWNGMLVGIVSHGDGCAKIRKPSVYANVYYLRRWIKQEMLSYVQSYCRDFLDSHPTDSVMRE